MLNVKRMASAIACMTRANHWPLDDANAIAIIPQKWTITFKKGGDKIRAHFLQTQKGGISKSWLVTNMWDGVEEIIAFLDTIPKKVKRKVRTIPQIILKAIQEKYPNDIRVTQQQGSCVSFQMTGYFEATIDEEGFYMWINMDDHKFRIDMPFDIHDPDFDPQVIFDVIGEMVQRRRIARQALIKVARIMEGQSCSTPANSP